ncbi:hypothetical protein EDC65_1239 [Stella humosa]|uniref:Uncharacterized protein n=1 Tax=Stella humosa TaxID=94 RepID=A0A3N1ME79_9PROT|nr:hypothetical protein [Stella humosa]ROQ02051.1 hypothetical protein EDC65_1239 [Stella humosa]BBK32441.1 hypothetical protein STHU_30750 [Stella humosa]
MAILFRSLVVLLVLSGIVVLPRAHEALIVVRAPDEAAILDYMIGRVPPADLEGAIGGAIAANDAETAQSLLDLADSRGIAVPAALRAGVVAIQGFNLAALGSEALGCVVDGAIESEAGLACVLAVDMTGAGDIRDLAREGNRYLQGQDHDGFTMAMATVGLAVTSATILSGGAALPVRVGVTVLKAAKKAGKLPPAIVREIADSVKGAIDGTALKSALSLAGRGRLREAATPLGQVLRPEPVRLVTGIAENVGGIYKSSGIRAVNKGMSMAGKSADLAKLQGLSARYGRKFLGVLTLLGPAVLGIAAFVAGMVPWVVAGAAWLFGLALVVARAGYGLVRILSRRRR